MIVNKIITILCNSSTVQLYVLDIAYGRLLLKSSPGAKISFNSKVC